MIFQKIRDASLAARKAKNTVEASLLVTLLAAIERIGKDAGREVTDEDSISVINSFLKGIRDTLAVVPEGSEAYAKASEEKAILEKFKPAQVDAQAVQAAIAEIVASLVERSPKQVGPVMAQLKLRFGPNFDAKIASEQIKKSLV